MQTQSIQMEIAVSGQVFAPKDRKWKLLSNCYNLDNYFQGMKKYGKESGLF
jgi:hypothetical protein